MRSTLGNRIARLFFVPTNDRLVVLHAFIKKTQATPKTELDIARTRQRDWEKNR
jgi:phage-related protein